MLPLPCRHYLSMVCVVEAAQNTQPPTLSWDGGGGLVVAREYQQHPKKSLLVSIFRSVGCSRTRVNPASWCIKKWWWVRWQKSLDGMKCQERRAAQTQAVGPWADGLCWVGAF